MARTNTDFLQFNAYQIKDTILRKLSEDSNFTDQVYEGSNLAILIDIVSYMLQGLLYSLNNAASESMFADTQFYENIVRLCQFLGYSVHGCATPAAEFIVNTKNTDSNLPKIPRYSYIKTNKTTPSGKTVYYSIGSNDINGSFLRTIIDNTNNNILNKINLYSGKWKLYKSALVTTGENWETFTLDLKSDYDAEKYVPHGFIDVYVRAPAENGEDSKWYQFKPVDTQLFRRNIRFDWNTQLQKTGILYTANLNDSLITENDENNESKNDSGLRQTNSIKDTVFNLRLDENKNYVITFGDGITAAKPPVGSVLYIVYLDSSGPGSEIEPGDIVDETITKNDVDLPDDFWNKIYNPEDDDISIYKFSNISKSTPYMKEETVDEIRENAPNWFKSGGRLVTKDDYENFFKYTPILHSNYLDVKCQNNWEYVSSFYRWLYDLGRKKGDPTYYLNQNSLIKSRYPCSDAADCNNIYLWYRPREESSLGSGNKSIGTELYEVTYAIKDMTHEPIPIAGIPVSFVITAAPPEKIKENVIENNYYDNTKIQAESYIEVLIDDNVMFTNSYVASIISEKVRTFFENKKYGLGMSPNFSELMSSIYDINGILRIRTIYYETEHPENAVIYNGLSFASYSIPENGLIDVCEDLEVSPNTRSLEIFQYPVYNINLDSKNNIQGYTALKNQFRVIKRSGSPLNVIMI